MPAVTPHLAAAAAIVLIALALSLGPLTSGAGDHDTPMTDLKVAVGAAERAVTPASAALAPLVPAYAARADGNPFVLRDRTVTRAARIPFPPPPPLTPQDPVVLPLPPEAQP